MRGHHVLQLGIILAYKQILFSLTVSTTETQYSSSVVQSCTLYELKDLGNIDYINPFDTKGFNK